MLIRKNTKAFKSILVIIENCQTRPDREKLIRLYITKVGQSIHDRISVEGIQGEADLFYEMNYQRVLNNLKSSNHQLYSSDELPGIYFFHNTSNKAWDESPFEFDEAITKEFNTLGDLPTVRKKEKTEKYVFPSPKTKEEPSPQPKKEKKAKSKIVQPLAKGSKQPDFKLHHNIEFTNLKKIIFRREELDKEAVLNYYNEISGYLLPYLKNRPLWIRFQSDILRDPVLLTEDVLYQHEEAPAWLRTATIDGINVLLCNDREHLLLFVERGCLEFNAGPSRIKSPETPDYFVLVIESSESDLAKTVEVALAAKEIVNGLQLPSFVKTDGGSSLNVYVPLDSKSGFEVVRDAAEYICKLIRVRVGDLVSLKGHDEQVYGKVLLDYSVNTEDYGMIAPYSLLAGEQSIIATPLEWEEVKEGLRPEEYNFETIFKRLRRTGDLFQNLSKKKIDAATLLSRLEENYSFLF